MPSGENKHYVDQPMGDHFFRYLEEELPDFVCGMFPISRRPEDTYLAGLSMGGYGALLHGLSHPERYAAIGAFSPAVHIDPRAEGGAGEEARPLPYDPLALARHLAKGNQRIPPLYISSGEEDFLFEKIVNFREGLREAGIEFTWSQTSGYGHEWRFWNEEIEKYLDWLPRTDAYAGKKRKC